MQRSVKNNLRLRWGVAAPPVLTRDVQTGEARGKRYLATPVRYVGQNLVKVGLASQAKSGGSQGFKRRPHPRSLLLRSCESRRATFLRIFRDCIAIAL